MLNKLVVGLIIICMLVIPACNKDSQNDDNRNMKSNSFTDNYDEDAKSDVKPLKKFE